MTQTGGLVILYAWLIFAGLLAILAYLLLRHEQDPLHDLNRPGPDDQDQVGIKPVPTDPEDTPATEPRLAVAEELVIGVEPPWPPHETCRRRRPVRAVTCYPGQATVMSLGQVRFVLAGVRGRLPVAGDEVELGLDDPVAGTGRLLQGRRVGDRDGAPAVADQAAGRPTMPSRPIVATSTTTRSSVMPTLLGGLPGTFPVPVLVVSHRARRRPHRPDHGTRRRRPAGRPRPPLGRTRSTVAAAETQAGTVTPPVLELRWVRWDLKGQGLTAGGAAGGLSGRVARRSAGIWSSRTGHRCRAGAPAGAGPASSSSGRNRDSVLHCHQPWPSGAPADSSPALRA